MEPDVCITSQKQLEKYSELLKKNRCLRIEIKSLLCEQKESQKKIAELKRSINVFGLQPPGSQTLETYPVLLSYKTPTSACSTKRELIKLRDYLLDENEGLLFRVKRKLI